MKVGILTLSASDNCGSLLQTYALQRYIQDNYNFDVSVIDFVPAQSRRVYDIIPDNFYLHPKKTLFSLKHFNSLKRQKKGYNIFREHYLNMTRSRFINLQDLQKITGEFDYLISGSDQIWNINMTDYSDCFFLPWKDTAHKIAYSASLGSAMTIPEEKKDFIAECLKDYDYISVREATGLNTLKNIVDKDIKLTVDPTLLLKTEQWNDLTGEKLIKGNYIFYYSWSYPDENMHELVKQFSESVNMPVYVINSSKWYSYRPEQFGFELFYESGPLAYLNLMRYAKYVFIQSFHGIVFANIFYKQFFFLNEKENGQIDFRVEPIIDSLEQKDRVVHTLEDIKQVCDKSIRYTSDSFEKSIEESKIYIEKCFKRN